MYVWRKPKTDYERQVPDHLEFIATDPAGMTYGFRFRPIWHGKANKWIPVEGDKAVPLGLNQQAPGDKASSTMRQKPAPVPAKPPVPPDRLVTEGKIGSVPAPTTPVAGQQLTTEQFIAAQAVVTTAIEDQPKKRSEIIKHKIAELKQSIETDEKVLIAKRRMLTEYQAEAFQALEKEQANGQA